MLQQLSHRTLPAALDVRTHTHSGAEPSLILRLPSMVAQELGHILGKELPAVQQPTAAAAQELPLAAAAPALRPVTARQPLKRPSQGPAASQASQPGHGSLSSVPLTCTAPPAH